jgi:HK97 family phage major capsid protein
MIPNHITSGPFLTRKVRGRFDAVRRLSNGSTISGSGSFSLLSAMGPMLMALLPVLLIAIVALAFVATHPHGYAMSFLPFTGIGSLRELAREKLAERAKLINENRAVLDTIEKEKREMSAEERTAQDKRWVDINNLRAASDELVKQAEAEDGIQSRTEPIKPDAEKRNTQPRVEEREYQINHIKGKRSYRFDPSLSTESPEYRAAFAAGMIVPTDRTKEETRALQMDSDTAGGFTVAPQQFVADLIQAVDNAVFMRGLATVNQLVGAHSIGRPSLDTDVDDSDWTSELLTGNEDSAMAFGKRELTPHPLAKRIKVSRKLLRHSPLGPEAIVRQRLAYKMGVTQEKAFMTGTGFQQPLGVFTASNDGISTGRDVSTDNTSTAVTFDGLKGAKWTLKSAYWPRAQWIAHRDFGQQVDKIKDGNGQYIWQASVVAGAPDRLLNFPINFSEYAPNTFTSGLYVGLLGDFSNYWIVESLSFEIQRLNELYAATNQVGFITRSELDAMPVLEEAFVRVKLG